MLTLHTQTRDVISRRLRAGRKFWDLRLLCCSAHNTSQSEEVYTISVPAHSPSVKFLMNTPLDQLMLASPQQRNLDTFTFPSGAHSLTYVIITAESQPASIFTSCAFCCRLQIYFPTNTWAFIIRIVGLLSISQENWFQGSWFSGRQPSFQHRVVHHCVKNKPKRWQTLRTITCGIQISYIFSTWCASFISWLDMYEIHY